MGALTHLCKKGGGEPSQNTAQQCVKEQYCDHDGDKLDKLRESWAFRVSTWNVDSLTGRLGELVEVLANGQTDVGCVQETRWKGIMDVDSLVPRANDINCFGWEVRRKLMV